MGARVSPTDTPARYVWHVRERRENGQLLRSNPWVTAALDDLARLDEHDSAFIRGIVRRVAFGLLLQKRPDLTAAQLMNRTRPMTAGELAKTAANEQPTERRRPAYQEAVERAGETAKVEEGYETANAFAGAPSSEEGKQVERIELRACAALRASRAALLGHYAGMNFSSSQQGTLNERQTVRDLQLMLTDNFYGPVYGRFVEDRWYSWLEAEPRLMPEDKPLLYQASHSLRELTVLEKHRTIPGRGQGVRRGAHDLRRGAGRASGWRPPTWRLYSNQVAEDHDAIREAVGAVGGPPLPGAGEGEDEDEGKGKDDE